VERILGDTTNKRVRRRGLTSIPKLTAAIHEGVAGHNENPKPFIWTI